MLRLLQLLFIGHWHKWHEDERVETTFTSDGERYGDGYKSYCTCTICGKPKCFWLH